MKPKASSSFFMRYPCDQMAASGCNRVTVALRDDEGNTVVHPGQP